MHKSIRVSAFLTCLAVLLSVPVMLPRSSRAMFTITIYFGEPGCRPGVGICRIDIGAARQVAKGVEAERAIPKSGATAIVEQSKPPKKPGMQTAAVDYFLKIEGLSKEIPGRPTVVPVAEDLALDAATSKALGHKSIKVLKGEYKVDYSKDKRGALYLKIEMRD